MWQRWRSAEAGALLLSLLFAAHVLCAAGAMDTASVPEAGAPITAAGPAGAAPPPAHATDGTDGRHHLCPSDANASTGADPRTSAATGAVLPAPGTGTTLLRAPSARAVPWPPPTRTGVPWSGTRLLISLCVQRV